MKINTHLEQKIRELKKIFGNQFKIEEKHKFFLNQFEDFKKAIEENSDKELWYLDTGNDFNTKWTICEQKPNEIIRLSKSYEHWIIEDKILSLKLDEDNENTVNYKLDFGKNNGKSIKDVFLDEPSYIFWLKRFYNRDNNIIKKILKDCKFEIQSTYETRFYEWSVIRLEYKDFFTTFNFKSDDLKDYRWILS